MQYAIGISYKYRLTELCILPYPFGLHRLPAPAPEEPQHWTRERLDTPRQHRSGRSASIRSGRGRKDAKTAPAAEPPQRSSPEAKRQKSQSKHDGSSGDKTAQQTLSPTRAAEIEPEPESQKRGTVDHERRRRQREGKERKEERERRENDSKTPLFSPSHRTPSRSTTRASPAPTDTDSSRNAAFFGSAFVEYAELTEINANFAICIGGVGLHFHDFSNAKNLALYPLLHASIFFTKHHLSNTLFINDIFPYKYKYLLLQTCLRKNALINAGSSSLDQHTKIHFYNFMLRNMP